MPLVSCPFFNTSLLDIDRPFKLDIRKRDSFVILMEVGGSGLVHCDGRTEELGHDGCLLIPASAEDIEFIPGPGGLKLLLGQL